MGRLCLLVVLSFLAHGSGSSQTSTAGSSGHAPSPTSGQTWAEQDPYSGHHLTSSAPQPRTPSQGPQDGGAWPSWGRQENAL